MGTKHGAFLFMFSNFAGELDTIISLADIAMWNTVSLPAFGRTDMTGMQK